jgi:hypothetical protein
MVALVPPICEPSDPEETVSVEPTASEEVATPATPAAPLVEYRSCEDASAEVVARPVYVAVIGAEPKMIDVPFVVNGPANESVVVAEPAPPAT